MPPRGVMKYRSLWTVHANEKQFGLFLLRIVHIIYSKSIFYPLCNYCLQVPQADKTMFLLQRETLRPWSDALIIIKSGLWPRCLLNRGMFIYNCGAGGAAGRRHVFWFIHGDGDRAFSLVGGNGAGGAAGALVVGLRDLTVFTDGAGTLCVVSRKILTI